MPQVHLSATAYTPLPLTAFSGWDLIAMSKEIPFPALFPPSLSLAVFTDAFTR